MASFLQVTAMGHLGGGRDGAPAVRLFNEPGQTPMALFSLAVNRKIKKQDQWIDDTVWFNCKVWGKDAERAAQYLTKGAAVLVVGEPQKISKFDPDTGEPRDYESLNVRTWTFAGAKRDSELTHDDDPFDVGDVSADTALNMDTDGGPGGPGGPGEQMTPGD